MNQNIKALMLVVVLVTLMYVWPNFIHEPIHLVALKFVGGNGHIGFDLANWPATPYIEYSGVESMVAEVFFRIAPSLFSLSILMWLLLGTRKPTIFTHVALPSYLVFDFIMNVSSFQHKGNDFYFLSMLNILVVYVLASVFIIIGLLILHKAMQTKNNITKQREFSFNHLEVI